MLSTTINVRNRPQRNPVAPWITLLTFGLILFAIAATISISLISVYLPIKDAKAITVTSDAREVTISLSNDSNVTTGILDNSTQTDAQSQMQSALSSDSSTSGKANVQIDSVAGKSRTLKKRKRQTMTQKATSTNIQFILIYTGRCTTRRCKDLVLESAIQLFQKLTLRLNPSASQSSTIPTTTNSSSDDVVTGDIPLISQYWANLRPYSDNTADYFGVTNIGLPDGCQVEQAFNLHRHAARFPSSVDDLYIKVVLHKLKNTTGNYTGLLAFLNKYTYQLGVEDLLSQGTAMAYQSGVDFWTKYGRILYNASAGQNFYDPTGQTKPVLRCNTIPRVTDTAVAWANGFFTLYDTTDKYTLVGIPADFNLNNTLASFFSCSNFINDAYGTFNSATDLYKPIDNYLNDTVKRLQQYAPSDVNLTTLDAFIMQELCAFEYSYFSSSNFCSLFTVNEWKSYRYTNDIYMYNGYSFGSQSGRALGLGVLQELLARLQNQTINVSNSSVNVSYDNNTETFPLGQKFYFETTHDFMLVALLTAMSLDYFRQSLSYSAYPPDETRHFKTTNIIPYAARIITEKIGCASANPTESSSEDTQYTATTNGYSPSNAPYKFIRMRLNSGILPLSTIRGGYCSGRTDGLCSLENFLASQANATTEANYQTVCFGNYTYDASLFTGDGNYFPRS